MTPEKNKKKSSLIWMRRASREGYVHRVLVAFDIFCNVILGGNEDETISSHVRRISDAHKTWTKNPIVWIAKSVNAGLDIIQPDHGQHAEAGDLERAEHEENIEEKALRFYGDGGTIWGTTNLDVETRKGKVVSVWFRCQSLPFRQSECSKERAAQMSSMYRHRMPEIHGLTLKDEN
ncbi:MAG: hypothetical protein ACYDBV_12485 [Nitrospiria bacterium]